MISNVSKAMLLPVVLTVLMLAGCEPGEAPDGGAAKKNPTAPILDDSQQTVADTDQTGGDAIDPQTRQDAQTLAQSQAEDSEDRPSEVEPLEPSGPAKLALDLSDEWKPLSEEYEIWLNQKTKQVLIGGKVCLNAGALEMFICPKGTKEHESVVSANVPSHQVHAALLAIGVEPGRSARWNPGYSPAWGPEIDIEMRWVDPKTKQEKSVSAKEWIRHYETKKPMEAKWVFGGSIFDQVEGTNETYYQGDSGELVCLSNFSTATIDLNVVSSQDNENLLFEAFTENIPAVGTQVYAVFKAGDMIGKPDSPAPAQSEPNLNAPEAADPTTDAQSSKDGQDEQDKENQTQQ